MLIGINLLYLIPGKVGGTETYARELITAMLSTLSPNDRLILFCTIDNAQTFSASPKTRVVTLPINASNRPLRLIAEQILLPIYSLINKVDVLFSLGYSAPFIHPCRSVVTIHDLNWYFHPEDFSLVSKFIWKYLTILSARFSDHIITDSSYSRDSIIKILGIAPTKITSVLHATPHILKVKKNPSQKKYIFTVLANYPHKNLKTLLSAFTQISIFNSNLELIICGLGEQPSSTKNVKYLGYVTRQQLATLYANAEVFVFPSAYEGFGYPVIEAMSYGAPVISSNATSLTEVVGNGGILVDPFDVESYVKQITKVLNLSSKDRLLLIKQGFKRASELKWRETAKQTIKVLKL